MHEGWTIGTYNFIKANAVVLDCTDHCLVVGDMEADEANIVYMPHMKTVLNGNNFAISFYVTVNFICLHLLEPIYMKKYIWLMCVSVRVTILTWCMLFSLNKTVFQFFHCAPILILHV